MEEKKDSIANIYEAEKDQENKKIQTDEAGKDQDEGDEGYPYIKPVGEPIYETDVTVRASDLFDYSLRHTYTSFSGLFSTIIGILMIYVFFAKGASPLYIIFGIIVVGYIPVNLFLMSRQQAMQESFRNPLHYAFYENGMEVSQGEIREMQEWDHIYKAISTSDSIIIYTGKNRASIFPRRDLKPDATALIQVICTHVDPKKVKIKQ